MTFMMTAMHTRFIFSKLTDALLSSASGVGTSCKEINITHYLHVIKFTILFKMKLWNENEHLKNVYLSLSYKRQNLERVLQLVQRFDWGYTSLLFYYVRMIGNLDVCCICRHIVVLKDKVVLLSHFPNPEDHHFWVHILLDMIL